MRDFVGHVRRHLSRADVPDERYDEVVDELASALEARYTALVEQGISEQDAWDAVLAQVPSWPSFAHDLSASTGTRRPYERSSLLHLFAPERWLRELTLGLRTLRKDRGFTLTAILTLTVCLGGHTAILAGINAILFNSLRTPEPERVLLMANQYPNVESRRGSRSATPDYHDRLEYVTAFEEQAFYNFTSGTIDTGGVAAVVRGMIATPSFFRLMRVRPTQGRLFVDEEASVGNETRVLLTDGFWRDRFNADPQAVGRTLRITGRDFTIVGVLPADFTFAGPEIRFWIPLALTDRQRSDVARHTNGWFSVGRLKPGATIEQVRDELKALDAVNAERTPAPIKPLLATTGFYTGVEPLQDFLVRDVQGPLYLLWSAAIAVLVVGIGNLANIALVRSRTRLSELGTRLAIGASRVDLLRQLLIESLLVAAGGAAGAFALGTWLLSPLRTRVFGAAPVAMDATVIAITLGLAAIAGLLIGMVSASPLFTMTLGTMLHEVTRSGTRGRAARATRRTLVVAQMACSFVLLVGSALLWISIRNLLAVDPGFRTDHVVTGSITLPSPRYASDDAARAFVARSLEAIGRLPGIASVGATTIVPLGPTSQSGILVAEGYRPQPGEPPVAGLRSFVTPGYFEAVGTPLVRGRLFDERETQSSAKSIIIDEALARRFWRDEDAVGRRIFWPANPSQYSIDANTPWLTVVGVVRRAQLRGPGVNESENGVVGTYYLPWSMLAPRGLGFVMRTHAEPTTVINDVRQVLAQIDRDIPLFDVRTMSERAELALMPRTHTMQLATLFAAVAVFLSALGLYGVLAYVVAQRRREIGVRLALGSAPRAIVGLVLREGLALAMAGIVLGTVGAVLLGRFVASQLYGVAPSDPLVMAAMAVTLGAVAALACIVPARRAASVDVMKTLSAP
jgi:predicted permease